MPTEVLAIAISIFSLLVAYFALRTNTLASARYHFMNALYDIDKQLIQSPALWTIYDNHTLASTKSMSAEDKAKREAFLYYYFNLFETAYLDYHRSRLLLFRTKAERDSYESLERWMRELFQGSTEARDLFLSAARREVFSPSFAAHVKFRMI